MERAKEIKVKVPVSAGSKIVGKTVKEIEKRFRIRILELDNTSDRAFLFSWEIEPKKSTTIKSEDEIVIFGKMHRVERLYKLAASLN